MARVKCIKKELADKMPDHRGNRLNNGPRWKEQIEIRKIRVESVNELLALHSRDGRTLYGVFKDEQLLCVGGTSKEARDRYRALPLDQRMVGECTSK